MGRRPLTAPATPYTGARTEMASEQWISWPHDDCPACGDSVRVLTAAEQGLQYTTEGPGPFCYCGDSWACAEGHHGRVYFDESTDGVELQQAST